MTDNKTVTRESAIAAIVAMSEYSRGLCVEEAAELLVAAIAQPVQSSLASLLLMQEDHLLAARIAEGYKPTSSPPLTMPLAGVLYAKLMQPVQPTNHNNKLMDAIDAVLSNQEHAFSGGMCGYQKGSPTWQIYEDLRIAQYNIAQPTQPESTK